MNLYDAIKKVAFQKGYSIRFIEHKLNFSNGTISKWNKSNPSIYNLKKVSDFLGVDINTLIYLTNKNLKEVM